MPFRPTEITKEHVLNAIEKIKSENIQLIPSTRYDVVIDGIPYPPKEVMRYAHAQLNGDKRWEYSGGQPTFKFLEQMGFEVKTKKGTDPLLSLLERYKSHIKESGLTDEIYKWKLVEQFKGRPNLDTEDFAQEIRGLNFSNLTYGMARAVMVHLVKERPELYRECLKNLLDEDRLLNDRIAEFTKEILKIYREIEGKNADHHDERTIAAFLTYRYPNKYTFYKESYYKKVCDLVGAKSKEKGKKYAHYLELIDDLVSEYIAEDADLLTTVKSLLAEDCFEDRNHKILAQDILYQLLDKTTKPNYWIFQANPKFYDLEAGLQSGLLDNWTVSAHKDKIKVDDKVILWSTGTSAGCYALAEVTEEPTQIDSSPGDHLWKAEDKNSLKAGIKVTHNLMNDPILKERIESIPGLKGLKVGTQGTNFAATKDQYDLILNLIEQKDSPMNETQSSLAINTILYGPPGTGKTYNSIDKAVEIVTGMPSVDHLENKRRFDELRNIGQIEFVTFHQTTLTRILWLVFDQMSSSKA